MLTLSEINKKVEVLAKNDTIKEYKFASKLYEFAHTTPFYYQKDDWPGLAHQPDKVPIICLETYITKHDRDKNLKIMAQQFPNISKRALS